MGNDRYKSFSDTIHRLNNLLFEIDRNYSYISFDEEEQYLINLLQDKINICEQEVRKLDAIKEKLREKLYSYHGIYKRDGYISVKNMDNYYIAYLTIERNRDTREIIGDFICCFDKNCNITREPVLGEKMIYSDKFGFLVGICADKKEEFNYYNFDFYYMGLKDNTWQKTFTISELREFYIINDNLLYFESNIDNHLMLYSKKNQNIIIDEIDKIERLNQRIEKFNNFDYGKHYLITKEIKINTKTIATYFFIDKYGNIASNVIDGYGNVYIINQEKELNAALKEIFKQIEEDLKQNNNQSKSKRLTLQTLPRLDNKK